jgi:O-antigen ligase
VIATIGLLSINFVSERLLSLESIQWTLGYRMASLNVALAIFESNPVVGVGYYGFRSNAWSHNPTMFFDQFDEHYLGTVPNQYLQTVTDAGLLGLLTLLVLLWAVVRLLVDAAHDNSSRTTEFCGLSAWAIGLLIGNQSAAWLLPYSVVGHIFFVIAGLAVAQRRLKSQGRARRNFPTSDARLAPFASL